MASFINNKTLKLLDERLDAYLVYLVHIQQSVNFPLGEKVDAFGEAERIGDEIFAISSKIQAADVNSYNEKDFEAFIGKTLGALAVRINAEIARYDRKLHFDDRVVFSIREAIEKLEETKGNTVYLTKDKIDRLLGYKVLYKTKKEEELERELDKEIEKSKKKLADDFDSVRMKTFKDMIRGENNKNIEYLFRTNKYILDTYLGREIPFLESPDETRPGIFFIRSPNHDIEVFANEDSLRIEYRVRFSRFDQATEIFIEGFIRHNESQVDFYVDEKYSNGMMDSVLNSFNLAPLIRKYNEAYAEFFHAAVSRQDTETEAKKEIDDFFAGKIL